MGRRIVIQPKGDRVPAGEGLRNRSCTYCWKHFVFHSGLRAHHDGFCSQRCQGKHFRRKNARKRPYIKPEAVTSRPDLVETRNFYTTPAWRRVRYFAIIRDGRKCVLCGATGRTDKLHVDHIKPRWRYPELALELSNLRVLCEPCNLGKGALDEPGGF